MFQYVEPNPAQTEWDFIDIFITLMTNLKCYVAAVVYRLYFVIEILT